MASTSIGSTYVASVAENVVVGSTKKQRIASIDVYRGLVMFLMLFQMVHLDKIAEKLQEGRWAGFWKWIHFHTTHVEWVGGSLHDMIQPGFSFLVGTAMAFSLMARQRQGQSWLQMFLHTIVRAVVLVALGVLLRNLRYDRIEFQFTDTLCQIGLGYVFLFLVASLPRWSSYVAVVLILVGYWIAFASYPVPPVDFDYPSVGVPSDWQHHRAGLESHWNKNSNLAWAVDTWFLNQFPHRRADAEATPSAKPAKTSKGPRSTMSHPRFTHNPGGYATLSFIPTIATMILGLIAGGWLRDELAARRRISQFIAAIAICFSLALLVHCSGFCPIVKRIWTPSWVLWSGGFCFAFLFFFHLICDVIGWKAWAFPLTVIGANSIVAYVMSFATVPFLRGRVESWLHFAWEPMGEGAAAAIGLTVFAIVWYVLYWMHKNRLYVRI
jgi:heparan-alpha-glucosaminide N-acetyltransferase